MKKGSWSPPARLVLPVRFQASHVLLAISRDFADAQGTLVITFGTRKYREAISIDSIGVLPNVVQTLRDMSPV